MSQRAIIIGAGPAGLTAAYELLKRTDIIPIILEKSGDIGGISKTVNYKGNRIDIGGHRFFSKSDRVMEWWMNIMPIENGEENPTIHYQNKSRKMNSNQKITPDDPDKVLLVRRRLSRIYFLRKFFAYPIQLSLDTLKKLGLFRTLAILFSYLWARLFPRKPEKSLEDFFINRFGRALYLLFFKDYTEKVWGVSCQKISAEWGAQRIKGISIGKAIAHAIKSLKGDTQSKKGDIHQKGVETSLIERFLYPKFGPGQLWEEVARQVQEMGGEIRMNYEVRSIHTQDGRITAVDAFDKTIGAIIRLEGDYFFSTMPIKELVAGLDAEIPQKVSEIAEGLQYRDFITVGVLLKQLTKADLKDTWIYIQERDVKVGRLQLFNNWSPYMVKEPGNVWIGMEYFCNDWDAFWNQPDETIKQQAIGELEKMNLAKAEDILDATVIRMEKTYPAYFGTYNEFDTVRTYLDGFENLFLLGRNGMHKYNNSDHSMLTAMVAVDNIYAGVTSKANIWAINTEQEYHEERSAATPPKAMNPTTPSLAKERESFKDFLLKNRWNRAFLLVAGIVIMVQFMIFKYFYPQAGFINGDSYVYLQTAYHNLPINTYPVGYSKFLRLFSVFTTSDTVLVAFQFLFLQSAALLLIFSLIYFYKPAKLTRIILFIFSLLNPVWLYLSNYVSSDSLFVSLSILWFTNLIWILERPNIRLLAAQVGLLLFIFTVRYNALYFPLITTLALLLSRQKLYIKLAGIAASVLVIGVFMWHTSNQYKQLTGMRQFSPFSGWQLANNALYAYRYVDTDVIKPVPAKFRALDKMVRHYFDTTRDTKSHPLEQLLANTFYMWDSHTPLQQYMNQQFKKDTTAKSLKKWATMGPLYADYGTWLIRNYPALFAKYYLWPNAVKYYAPPVEFLDTYNMGRDTVAEMGRIWFHYKSNKIKTHTKNLNVAVLDFYPILAGALNIVFLFSCLFFGMLDGFRKNRLLYRVVILTGSLWLFNFGFSVFASPVALRFQLFPLLVCFSFSLLLVEYIYRRAFDQPGWKFDLPAGDRNPAGKPRLV